MKKLNLLIVSLIVMGFLFSGCTNNNEKSEDNKTQEKNMSKLILDEEGLKWYGTGIGGGGWLYSGAYLPSDPEYILIGSDIAGCYLSTNGGYTFHSKNVGGMSNHDDIRSFYVSGLVGVENDYFNGFFAATFGGIFSLEKDADQWTSLTPVNFGYSYTKDPGWGQEWEYALPFASIDWDGENLLLAGAGEMRWGNNGADLAVYPTNYWDEDSCPLGYHSLWQYNFSDSNPTWEPYPLRNSNMGTIRDIKIVRNGNNITIAICTLDGVYIVKKDQAFKIEVPVLYNDNQYTFDFGDPNNGHDSVYNIYLTKRGTLYVGIYHKNTEKDYPSGLYRIHDINKLDKKWQWCANNEIPVEILNNETIAQASYGGAPSTHYERLSPIYFTVVEGVDLDPDTIYIGSRTNQLGLAKVVCDFNNTHHEYQIWEPLIYNDHDKAAYTNAYHGIDARPIATWGAHLIFEPIIYQNDPNYMFIHTNVRLHKTEDGGETWENIACWEHPTMSGYWHSTGYREMAVKDIEVASDGRIFYSTADVGLMETLPNDYRFVRWKHLPKEKYAYNSDAKVWSNETEQIEIMPDWLGSGKDCIVVEFGYSNSKSGPSKVMALFNWNNDNFIFWKNCTLTLPDANRYLFSGGMVSVENEVIYVTYTKYNTVVSRSAYRLESGVMKLTYNANTKAWTQEKWNTGLPARMYYTDICFSKATNKMFLSARTNHGPGGGIWIRELNEPNWTLSCGYDGSADQPEQEDIRCVEATPNGGVIYAGTRGGAADGIGTIMICENPEAALPTWEILANTDASNSYFNFPHPACDGGRNFNTELKVQQYLTTVNDIYVDPNDTTEVYMLLRHWNNYQDTNTGIWKMKNNSNIVKIDRGSEISSFGGKGLLIHNGILFRGSTTQELWLARLDSLPMPEFDSLYLMKEKLFVFTLWEEEDIIVDIELSTFRKCNAEIQWKYEGAWVNFETDTGYGTLHALEEITTTIASREAIDIRYRFFNDYESTDWYYTERVF